jgi:signal transduction histidine kinase
MSGLFGGALLAFASALVALALSRDYERLWSSAPIVILGTCMLGVIAFAKVTAFGFSPTAHWLVLVLTAPVACLPIALALDFREETVLSPDSLRLRDAAGQAERTRLARDLHDSVKQQLYSIQAHLATVDARWKTDDQGSRTALAHARTGARDAMREMAALLDRLQENPIEAVGLVEALRRQCEALGFQTGAQVTTEFGTLPDPNRLDAAITNTFFRIGQEALANVARHARPTRVDVFAGVTKGPTGKERFALRIEDDGCGFDTNAPRDPGIVGMGLRSMRARAQEIGATLAVMSVAGQGTVVEVTLPMPSVGGLWLSISRRLLVGIGLPTAALLAWSFSWPEWSPYLQTPVITGVSAIFVLGVWIAVVRSSKW